VTYNDECPDEPKVPTPPARHHPKTEPTLSAQLQLPLGGDEVDGPTTSFSVRHPAKFSDTNLARLDQLVPAGTYLDPFAGTGRVHELQREVKGGDGAWAWRTTVGIEIQAQWANLHAQTHVGNALALPDDWTGRFDGIITSPCYGNRFADHHNAHDSSTRRSYTHDLRTMTGDDTLELEPDNTGTLYFRQPRYESDHRRAWAECHRVTRDDALMFLNLSNFIDRGAEQPVVGMHIKLLAQTGWTYKTREVVQTPRMRRGANHEARVEHEVIVVALRI
jgi:hypothetical protein